MAGTIVTKEQDKQGFERVIDPLEIRRLISRAVETGASVEVRLPAIRFSSSIREDSDPKVNLKIVVPEEAQAELRKLAEAQPAKDAAAPDAAPADNECMIIAFLEGAVLLCIRGQNATLMEDTLYLPPPWDVFKLQRRKEPRFDIPTAYELYVSMESVEGQKLRVKKRILDISSSGLGFHVLSTREAEFYKKGMFLRRMSLTIEGRQIFLDAQVKSSIDLTGDPMIKGVKIGILFIRIGPVDARYIAGYVARNLAQLIGL